MTTVNLYTNNINKPRNIKAWATFFKKYLPDWELQQKSAENILDNNPTHLLFPGGRGKTFAKRLGQFRLDEISEWVKQGGSYIGVCAGAYLAVQHLNIAPLITPDKKWKRGKHLLKIELDGIIHEVIYNNGPIFELNNSIDVWATFKSDHLAEGGFYRMIDTPAITHNTFGKGKVTLFSPHLEVSCAEMKNKLAALFKRINSF